jgi:hypothetical protein
MALLEAMFFVFLLICGVLALAYGLFWIRAQFVFLEQQGRVPCPHCAELIQPAATICRYCQREVGDALKTPKSPRGLFQ